jgi:hypothetical protein
MIFDFVCVGGVCMQVVEFFARGKGYIVMSSSGI